jgi:tetratricopeptide (TPR) repeat protein
MTDHSLGQRSRSSKRSISAIIGCIVAGIGIGLASTQVVHGQDLVPAPPVDVDPEDPAPGLEALPRKRDDNLLRTNAPPPSSDVGAEIPRLLGSNLENPFAKPAGSDGQAPAPPSDASAAENTAKALLWKAYGCQQEKKFDQALEYSNQAIVCSPRSVKARGYRARALIDLGRYSEALSDLDFVIQQVPDSYRAYAQRGHVRFRLLKPDIDDAAFKPALADITRALELKSDDPLSRLVRGMIAARRGNYDQAITDLSWAIEHDYDWGDARYSRGRSFAIKGETDRAIADFTEALKQYPKSDFVYTRRAQLYTEKQDFDHALADFDQVVRLQPDRAQGYLQRTTLLLLKGDNVRALADIEKVIRILPESAVAHFMHAIALYLVEPKSDRALAEIDKVIDLDSQVIVYPAFRCFLNGKKTRYGPVFKDLALCAAVLAQSRLRYHVTGDQKQSRFQVNAGLMAHDRCTLGFFGGIDFKRENFFLGVGFRDDSKDLEHKDRVSETDRKLINQNVLNLLAATFVGASD